MERSTLKSLGELVELVLESRMREAEVTGGTKVPHGSSQHIKDLKTRIADLERWRSSQRRGSEQRANYSRIISKLKSELRSAVRATASRMSKKQVRESFEGSPEERWAALAQDPEVVDIVAELTSAETPRDLSRAKRSLEKLMDDGTMPAKISDGFVGWLYDRRKEALSRLNYTPRSAADSRADQVLRTTNSDGRKTARRMS